MFTIKTEELGDLSTIKLINSITGEYVEVIPGYGAALNALVLRKNNSFIDIIDGCQTYDQLLGEGTTYYKGMVLYPFPNRIAGATYTFEGSKYTLEANEEPLQNALHGFAAFDPFHIKRFETNGGFIELELTYLTAGNEAGWPFKSKLTITYVLTATNGMSCKATIENTGDRSFPVGLGWHPYFKALNKVDTLELKIPAKGYLENSKQMVPTGALIQKNKFESLTPISESWLDTCYPLEGDGASHLIELHDSFKNATIEIWLEKGTGKFNFAQFYIPPHRRTVAIEPMTCPANAFNSGIGLIQLAPGGKHEVSYGIRVR